MATFLLTWNPNSYDWETLADDAVAVRTGEDTAEDGNWSVGRRNSGIGPGDRFFMLRQGPEPRGIMASGTIESSVWEGERWTGQGTANYVDVYFDALVDPDSEPERMIPMADLIERFEGRYYFTRVQQSGQQLPEAVADELEELWAELHGSIDERENRRSDGDGEQPDAVEPLAEKVSEDSTYLEGAVSQIVVNAYERNAAARRKCIEHYGARCCVCDFEFEEVYGELGEGFIHVHHLTPLSEIGEEYELDPIRDLRPICPNCHAMIHRPEEMLTIKKLRAVVRKHRT